MARPRRSLKINGRAGRDKNFFQMSASKLQQKKGILYRPENKVPRNHFLILACFNAYHLFNAMLLGCYKESLLGGGGLEENDGGGEFNYDIL
jgi:hypothetical protein